MAYDIPTEFLAYWTANKIGLPKLWFEFAPEGQYPPVAIFWLEGFSRDPKNLNFKIDTYRYKVSLLGLDPVTTYEQGFAAVEYMNNFEPTGHIMTTPEPEQFATPSEAGQANIWEYSFTIDLLVQPVSPLV